MVVVHGATRARPAHARFTPAQGPATGRATAPRSGRRPRSGDRRERRPAGGDGCDRPVATGPLTVRRWGVSRERRPRTKTESEGLAADGDPAGASNPGREQE